MSIRELELLIAAGAATMEDLQSFAAEDVRKVKAALPYGERIASFGPLKPQTKIQADSKVIEMIANVQVVDRMGDLLLSNPRDAKKYGGVGWELGLFDLAGGPYLHAHNHDFTIGKVGSHRIGRVALPALDDEKAAKASALIIAVEYFDHEDLPFSKADYLLAREGLTASSVGFIPKLMTFIEDQDERNKLGLGPFGAVIPTMELLEVSKVAVPANQVSAGDVKKALDRYVGMGDLRKSLAEDYKRGMDAAHRVGDKLRSIVEFRGLDVDLECVGPDCNCTSEPATESESALVVKALEDAATGQWEVIVSAAPILKALGVETTDEALEAIENLKSATPDSRVHRRLDAVFDAVSAACEQVQALQEEVESGEVSLELAAPKALDIPVEEIAQAVARFLVGGQDAEPGGSSSDASGGTVTSDDEVRNGSPEPGGENELIQSLGRLDISDLL